MTKLTFRSPPSLVLSGQWVACCVCFCKAAGIQARCLLLLAKKVAPPKSAQTSTPSPHPGFLAPRGAPWMAGDGFTRRELAGGRTAAN